MTSTLRARARFGAYAALAVVVTLMTALLPEYRIAAACVLGVLAFWWLRLDPVGPEGDELDALAELSGLAIRLRHWLAERL